MQAAPAPVPAAAPVLFFGGESPFSNFHPCSFVMTLVVDGVSKDQTFSTSEQAFMALKAIEFGDAEHLQKITVCPTPKGCKKLGRAVRNFDEKQWTSVRYDRMLQVCRAKFTQNEHLRTALLATGDRTMGEASPFDRVWGIGCGVSKPESSDPAKWKGSNLLGKILMQIREEIRGAGAETEVKRARVSEQE